MILKGNYRGYAYEFITNGFTKAAYAEAVNTEEWDCAVLNIFNTEGDTINVLTYNFCRQDGYDDSAIYNCLPKDGEWVTDYSAFTAYPVTFNRGWQKALCNIMLKIAYKVYINK